MFATMECPKSYEKALCHDQFSKELLEYELDEDVELEKQTVGEVLKLHGIDRFCCCSGDNCNQVNFEIEEAMRPQKFIIDTYDESKANRRQLSPGENSLYNRYYGNYGNSPSFTFGTLLLFLVFN